METRKKRHDIINFSQTGPDVELRHSLRASTFHKAWVDIELNSFLYFAQSCNHAGTTIPSSSRNSTTSSWKTLAGTNPRMDKGQIPDNHRSRQDRDSHQQSQRSNSTEHDDEDQCDNNIRRGASMDLQLLQ
eukprot:2465061-Amphidinium_carterae.4